MTESILLVEDDNADALLIERALRKAKVRHSLHRVDNGDAAVDYLSEVIEGVHPVPAMVLLDLKLPRRSGFEVLAWLRGCGAAVRRVPVIVLTSSQHGSDVDQAYDLGANSYLVKPGDPEGLLRVLQQVHSYWLELSQLPSVSIPS